jgi:hypothetical protein
MKEAMLSLQKPQAGLVTYLIDAMRDHKTGVGASIAGLSAAPTDAVRIAAEGVRNGSAANTAVVLRISALMARQSLVSDVVVVGGVILCGFVALRAIDYLMNKRDEIQL